MGIDKYNEECRSIVMRYSKDWEAIVHRLGRWIDFEVRLHGMVCALECAPGLCDGRPFCTAWVGRRIDLACWNTKSVFLPQNNYKMLDSTFMETVFP